MECREFTADECRGSNRNKLVNRKTILRRQLRQKLPYEQDENPQLPIAAIYPHQYQFIHIL
jgi:hypothetical protein